MIHGVAAAQCVAWADKWVARFCPANEVAQVIAEDRDKVKKVLKTGILIMTDKKLIELMEGSPIDGLPLTRIIDTISFHEKQYAPILQLADLCAFVLRRGLAEKRIPLELWNPIASLVKATRDGALEQSS